MSERGARPRSAQQTSASRLAASAGHSARPPVGETGTTFSGSSWDSITLLPNPLPGFSFGDIDTATRFLGRRIGLPVLLEHDPHTRSLPEAGASLLATAQELAVAVNLGPLESIDPSTIVQGEDDAASPPALPILAELRLRQVAQSGFDLGAVDRIRQLRLQAVILRLDLAEAAIVEPEQAGGEGFELLEALSKQLPVPIVPRDPAGLPRAAARVLADRGTESLITGGAEVFAGSLPASGHTGQSAVFAHWGLPALAAIRMLRGIGPTIVSDAGFNGGLEAAKAIALGADLVVLRVGREPRRSLEEFARALRTTMYLSGARTLSGLKAVPFVATGATREWLEAAESLWRADSSPRA